MELNQSAFEYETKRLEQTIALAERQLKQTRERSENTETAILDAKRELRENTTHSFTNLYNGEDFEALSELNQYMDPITEKVADYEKLAEKMVVLEKMIDSPYFARIDFCFEDEDEHEEIYIGRNSLRNEETFDISVYDWRSPIASVFYRYMLGPAGYDAPGGRISGEVSLKRQYEISKSELEYFFDSEVQIVDEFLRKLLSKNTSSKMKTIVETIQKEQDMVIRDMETDLMMVQGVAGSGKTSIALHRAAYLMYQGLSARLQAENILIVSPNTLFEQYISSVLPELGEHNVVSVVFEDMLSRILRNQKIQSRNHFLEKLISDSNYRDIIKDCIEFKMSWQFIGLLDRFIEDIPHRFIEFQDVYYTESPPHLRSAAGNSELIISKEKLKEKTLHGRSETPLGKKLELMGDYIIELVRETKKKRLRQEEEQEIRAGIKAFTSIKVTELYRALFHDKEYFRKLAEGMELPANMDEIFIFTQENLYDHFIYYDDAAVLAYLNLKIYGSNDYKNIRQVVIDEAQDYYPLHFELFHLMFGQSRFTVLGDINQTLEKSEDLSLYEQIKAIFNKKTSSLVTMDKSFRCTTEILNFGAQFLEEGLSVKSFNRSGDEPQIIRAADRRELNELIAAEIAACQEQGYQSVGLICKTEEHSLALYDELQDKADVQLVKNESETDLHGTFIMPVYMSKGLEFDAVLICDTDCEHYHTADDKKLLYIASTRALHRLNLFYQGDISPLL